MYKYKKEFEMKLEEFTERKKKRAVAQEWYGQMLGN